jgi:rhodanese-related sulfurtransferase
MTRIIRSIFCQLLFIVLTLSCIKPEKPQSEVVVDTLTAEDFKSKLASTPDAVLLDVRTPEEVAKGVIPSAKNIDLKSSDFQIQMNALDKNKTYFVYCAKGGRSSKAIDIMKQSGFKKLINLESGYRDWVERGLPVE